MSEIENPHVMSRTGLPVYFSLLGDTDAESLDGLLEYRRRLSIKREELIAKQKAFAKDKDFESAKSCSSNAKDIMRMIHAIQNFLAYLLAAPPGDCVYKDMKEWGYDLAPECRSVDAYLSCGADQYIKSLLED